MGKENRDEGVQLLLEKRGTAPIVAKAVGCTPQAVSQWKTVPAHHVLAIEEATGISRHKLRPDIYPRGT